METSASQIWDPGKYGGRDGRNCLSYCNKCFTLTKFRCIYTSVSQNPLLILGIYRLKTGVLKAGCPSESAVELLELLKTTDSQVLPLLSWNRICSESRNLYMKTISSWLRCVESSTDWQTGVQQQVIKDPSQSSGAFEIKWSWTKVCVPVNT